MKESRQGARVEEERATFAECRVRPTLAVDIDNVLARAEIKVQNLYHELTGAEWPRARHASAGGLDTGDLDPDVVEAIFDWFHEHTIPHLPLLPSARFALELLQVAYRIVLVTSRRPSSRPQTLQWVRKQRIPCDVLYHAEIKTEIPEFISFAVEDHPGHAMRYVEAGIGVFLMDHPWNRGLLHPRMIRVTGWDALVQMLHIGNLEPHLQYPHESTAPARLWQELGYRRAQGKNVRST